MIHKLEITHKIHNRDEVAYAVAEIRKAQETLKELYKDKEKYKDKIRILAQHIHNVRDQATLRETYECKLTRNKPKGYQRKATVESFKEIHESLIDCKQALHTALKETRRRNKLKNTKWSVFGIKRYAREGTDAKGFVHTKPNTIIELLKSKMIKTIKTPKLPFNKDNHVGVEIEFASFLSEDQIGQLFLDAGLIEFVQLDHEFIEGRDKNNGEKEYELCVVAPEMKIFEIIERVCSVLNEKVDANITFGCGLHVHIDARNRNIRKMFDNLFNCQEILYSMVAHTRRTNRHVQLMDRKQWMPPKDGFRHKPVCKDEKCVCTFINKEDFKNKAFRYYGLNTWSYISHNTMEVRIHSGTANAVKINNWIKILLSIVDGKPIKGYIRNVDEFKNAVRLDSVLTDYVEKRIENFKREAM